MPWIRLNMAPIMYVLIFYATYMLFVFPITELIGYVLRNFTDFKLEMGHSLLARWIYIFCLLTFLPCYLILFYASWLKNRAKPLFVPKWKTSDDLDEEDIQCTICYDLIVEPRTLRCQHSFCKKCIDQCLPLTRRCPSCQQWVYWSSANKLLNDKVLNWVKEQGREEEYAEVVQMKSEIKKVKTGCMVKLWPILMPFFEVPERNQRNGRRLRPIVPVNTEPTARAHPNGLVVEVIDEFENAPVGVPSSSPTVPSEPSYEPMECTVDSAIDQSQHDN